MGLETECLEFVKKNKACFFSDISRSLGISNNGARDIARILEKEGKVRIIDKGTAMLVIYFG